MKSPTKPLEKVKEQSQKQSCGKVLEGTVVSVKTKQTVIVAVTDVTRHPLYRKTMKKTRRYAVDTAGQTVTVDQKVHIMECRPLSKTKHFRLQEAVK